MERKYVENKDVRISYQVGGSSGPPLVLIHGWSGEGRYWDEFGYVSRLQDRFQIVLPDLRGHGDSGMPLDNDYSDAAFASDVSAVLDDLSIESAHVFGYSLGGWIAFELASTFPQRIKSVTAGGAHPYDEDVSPIKELTPNAIVTAWDDLGAQLSSTSRNHLAEASHLHLIEMLDDRIDLSARLLGLSIPFLLICGTEDWRFEEMQRFAQAKENCRFVPLDGHDHLSAWLQPELIVPRMLEFLT